MASEDQTDGDEIVRRISVHFTDEEMKVLTTIAENEIRGLKNQIRYFVLKGLKEAGFELDNTKFTDEAIAKHIKQ